MEAESCLAAFMIGGQWAKILVVLKRSPKSSRSLAKLSFRIGSPPSSSISRTLGMVSTSFARPGPRGLWPSRAVPRRAVSRALEHEDRHVVPHPAGRLRHDLRRERFGLRL